MTATISDCGLYRYTLQRGDAPRLPLVMLNPSKADAETNDPTIRRCNGFAARLGFSGIDVVNLFAVRATDPRHLLTMTNEHATGPQNDMHLISFGFEHRNRIIVVAWGTHAPRGRALEVEQLLTKYGARLWCFGKTKDGSPRHPLYLRADEKLVPFRAGG